jgi:AraC-like DNA-binding protein
MSDVSREYCQVVEDYVPPKWKHHQRVPMEIYLQGLNSAAKVMKNSLWGFTVGKCITSAEYGLLGYLVESCDTLQSALEALLQFDKTVADIGQIEFENNDNVATLIWQPYFHNRHAVLRNITAWVATVRRVTGKQLSPHCLHLQDDFSSQEVELLEGWFGCSVQPTANKNSIAFDLTLLEVPILTRNELVNNHLLLATTEAKKLYVNEYGWFSGLQPVLHSADLHSLSLLTLAEILCMSPRTLQRRLKLNDMSFSQLLDDERKRRFEQFVHTMRKQMLSDLLGYSEQASLNRAVKRWHGISPSGYLRNIKKTSVIWE